MAASLRHALSLTIRAAVLLIYLPLLPAAMLLLTPALSLNGWRRLFAEPQLWQAAAATLVSTLLAVGGALLIALTVIAALWPSPRWRRLTGRLPWLLAVPHVAFATGALLLFADGGWLSPGDALPVDRYGVGLGLTLAIKESGFLLWTIYALLGEKRLAEQAVVLQSLGYGRWQRLGGLILPELAPALGVALLATAAWTLSAVDVALVLGPGNPPTLAVLAWQWLTQGDPETQAMGALACLLLAAMLASLAGATRLLWRIWRRRVPDFSGRRRPQPRALAGHLAARLLPLSGLACVLALLALARGALPEAETVGDTLRLATFSALIGGALCLLWLEWGTMRGDGWLWLPLFFPALPLAAGQYQLALRAWLDGEFVAVLWGHLLWVMPWMLFVLRPAWRQLDPRLPLIARTLGWGRGRIFLQIKCPLLIRPLLSALAVGFSVSIAQYLPTLWLGAGRIATLTTEAVALSSGGSTPLLAAQALWQLLLPAIFFMLTALLARLAGRRRQGLR